MKRNILNLSIILFAAILITGCSSKQEVYEGPEAFVNEAKENVPVMAVDELEKKMKNNEDYLVLDVREPNEYNPGFIPGAVNIPRGTLEFMIGKEAFWDAQGLYMPEKDAKIILYCKKGDRSILSANTLKKMGYENIHYLEGGFKNWETTYPHNYYRNEVAHDDHGGGVGGC